MYNTTATNPFNVIQEMDTNLGTLALSAIGGSAIFQAAFEIARAIDMEAREELEARFGAKTVDARNEEDAFEDGNDESERVRDEQGHNKANTSAASRRRTAKCLIDIHTHCCEEIKAHTSDEFAQPQSMIGAIVFLCRGEPRALKGAKGEKVEELIKKGILTAERVQQRAQASAERTAKSWNDIGEDVMAEYLALQRDKTFMHEDTGASGASEESLGEHAFNQLPPEMAIALWDKFLAGFASKFENFTMRIVDGFEKEVKFNEIDKFVILFNDAREACKQARIRYYKAHRNALDDSAGAVSTPTRQPPVPGSTASGVGSVAATTEPTATPAQDMQLRLSKLAAAKPPKDKLPIL